MSLPLDHQVWGSSDKTSCASARDLFCAPTNTRNLPSCISRSLARLLARSLFSVSIHAYRHRIRYLERTFNLANGRAATSEDKANVDASKEYSRVGESVGEGEIGGRGRDEGKALYHDVSECW